MAVGDVVARRPGSAPPSNGRDVPPSRLRAWLTRTLGTRRGEPCTPDTRRCEFWSWGPGYLRPSCCTAHLIRLIDFTHELLDRHGISHWIDYGTLLGAVRDGRLIPWDEDVDLGIRAVDLDAVLSLATEIESAGHQLDTSNPLVVRINLSPVNTQHVDIYAWREEGDMLRLTWPQGVDWPGMKDRDDFPVGFVDHLEPVVLEGRELMAPSPVERFLVEHRYGPDFRVPLRPVIERELYPDSSPEELTPLLLDLFQAIGRTESELLSLEQRWMRRLAPLSISKRWARSGRPEVADREHLERARGQWSPEDGNELVEQTFDVLARLEQAVDEVARPSSRTRLRRAARRARKLARHGRRLLAAPTRSTVGARLTR